MTPNNPHIGVGPSVRVAVQPIDLVQYAVVVFHHNAHAVISPTTPAAALPVQGPSIAGIAAPIHGQQQLRPQRISHPIHLGHDQPPPLEQLRRRQLPRLPRAVARLEEPPARRRHVPIAGLGRVDQTVDGRAAGAIAAGIAELAEAPRPDVVHETLSIKPALGQLEDVADEGGRPVDVEVDGQVAERRLEEEGHGPATHPVWLGAVACGKSARSSHTGCVCVWFGWTFTRKIRWPSPGDTSCYFARGERTMVRPAKMTVWILDP